MFHCFKEFYIDFDINVGTAECDYIVVSEIVGDGFFPGQDENLIDAYNTMNDYLFHKFVADSSNQNVLDLDNMQLYEKAEEIQADKVPELMDMMWKYLESLKNKTVLYVGIGDYFSLYVQLLKRMEVSDLHIQEFYKKQVTYFKHIYPFKKKNQLNSFEHASQITYNKNLIDSITSSVCVFDESLKKTSSIELQLLFYAQSKLVDKYNLRRRCEEYIYNSIDGELTDLRSTILNNPDKLSLVFEGLICRSDWEESTGSFIEFVPDKYSFFFQDIIRSQFLSHSEKKIVQTIVSDFIKISGERNFILTEVVPNLLIDVELGNIFKIDKSYSFGSLLFGSGRKFEYTNPLIINYIYSQYEEI